MYYKMIISRWNTDPEVLLKDFLDKMGKLYIQNGVVIVGEWIDMDDPLVTYLILGYENEKHYKEFVEKMKNSHLYGQLNRELDAYRKNFENKTLKYSPHINVNLEEHILDQYIQDIIRLKSNSQL